MQKEKGKNNFIRDIFLGFSSLLLLLLIFSPGNVSHAADYVKIGMKEEPKTLNYWLASDRWSNRVLSLVYSSLYFTDPISLKNVPWLAESNPVYDEKTNSFTIKLRKAKWADGSELTSEDVAFTGNLIKEFKVPGKYPYWKYVNKIETPDKRTVIFYLERPMAVFESRTLTVPILPKREWKSVVDKARKSDKPLKALRKHSVKAPLGSGPFFIQEWRKGAYVFLKKNKNFFGKGLTIEGKTLGPFVDGIIFKFYGTSDAAVLAIKKGDIDMFWWQIEAGYLDELKAEKEIELFYNERSALYYMGFNLRRPPFDNLSFRKAVATMIDKDFIIKRLLQGYGIKMNCIVPSTNREWYCPDVPVYGANLDKEGRIRDAYKRLKEAGYTWKVAPVDSAGKIVKGKGIIDPGGNPVKQISILTPQADYDPARAMAGLIIQEWLIDLGIRVRAKPMAIGSLIDQTKIKRDFDAFILGYGRLRLDPDYLRKFFHSTQDKVRGQNRSGFRNPEFDKISDQSAGAMDQNERREMIFQMQRIIMEELPWVPLYNPKLIEAVRKDKFIGWVNALEGIGNNWSFCILKPK